MADKKTLAERIAEFEAKRAEYEAKAKAIHDEASGRAGKFEGASVTVKANASINGTSTDMATYLPATVNSVTLSKTGGEIMLNLAGLGSIGMSKVQTIGL